MNYTDTDRYMYYIHNEIIVNKKVLLDTVKPMFMSQILRNRLIGLTIWKDFIRKAEYKDREIYTCVVDGRETFILVSPIYKQNIYSGVYEEYAPDETPINFFDVNTT